MNKELAGLYECFVEKCDLETICKVLKLLYYDDPDRRYTDWKSSFLEFIIENKKYEMLDYYFNKYDDMLEIILDSNALETYGNAEKLMEYMIEKNYQKHLKKFVAKMPRDFFTTYFDYNCKYKDHLLDNFPELRDYHCP